MYYGCPWRMHEWVALMNNRSEFCYINRAGAPYFLRLCDFSGNLYRKMIKLIFCLYACIFPGIIIFRRVGIINHQIRKCANKYIRDRLQCLRSSKIVNIFQCVLKVFFSQLGKSSELVVVIVKCFLIFCNF